MDANQLETFKQSTLTNPIAQKASYRTSIQKPSSETQVSLAAGFPEIFSKALTEGGKYVSRKDMNGFLYIISSVVAFLQNGGVFTFDRTFSGNATGYAKGAKLWFKNAKYNCWTIIESTQENNKIEPAISTVDVANGAWKTVFPPMTSSGQLSFNASNGISIGVGEEHPSTMSVSSQGKLSVPSLEVRTTAEVQNLTCTDRVTTKNLTLNGGRATGCPTPVNDTDFVNKAYVDSAMNIKVQVVDSIPAKSNLAPNTLYFVRG